MIAGPDLLTFYYTDARAFSARDVCIHNARNEDTFDSVSKRPTSAILMKLARFSETGVACGLLPVLRFSLSNALHVPKRRAYSWMNRPMSRLFAATMMLLLAPLVTPAYADVRTDAKAQVEFGINVAQRGLWREAIYRWEKAVEIDPTYAAAFNDLAVAYEHEGQLDKARDAYEKALALEPNNTQIKQNYELFKEINDRTSAAKKETP